LSHNTFTSPSDEDLFELTTHSFVVKIWRENRAQIGNAPAPTWRGHITHVPDGERRSVQNLNEIGLFIAPYLPLIWLLRRWMIRWLGDRR
jgi:hypothetical protein